MASPTDTLSEFLEPWKLRMRNRFPLAQSRVVDALVRSMILVAGIVAAGVWFEGVAFYLSVILLCVAGFGLQAYADARVVSALVKLSLADPLTGIGNRRALQARLAEEVARCERGSYSVAILMIDVDKLKDINDRDGHRAGDDALRAIAGAICSSTRISDVVGRLGGDEFMVIAPQTGEADARALAERVVANARRIPLSGGGRQGVGLSIGVAVASSTTADRQVLLDQADLAMYEAKARGGNRVVCFGQERTGNLLHLRPVWDR